jgi:hypothetical protein
MLCFIMLKAEKFRTGLMDRIFLLQFNSNDNDAINIVLTTDDGMGPYTTFK